MFSPPPGKYAIAIYCTAVRCLGSFTGTYSTCFHVACSCIYSLIELPYVGASSSITNSITLPFIARSRLLRFFFSQTPKQNAYTHLSCNMEQSMMDTFELMRSAYFTRGSNSLPDLHESVPRIDDNFYMWLACRKQQWRKHRTDKRASRQLTPEEDFPR